MYTSKWCNAELNSGSIGWEAIKGEIKEVIEAETYAEFKEEVADVLYFTYCAIETKWGINLPMFGAKATVEKVIERIEVWKMIFNNNGLEFKAKYLVNGSNYKKDVKVLKALELARKDQIA